MPYVFCDQMNYISFATTGRLMVIISEFFWFFIVAVVESYGTEWKHTHTRTQWPQFQFLLKYITCCDDVFLLLLSFVSLCPFYRGAHFFVQSKQWTKLILLAYLQIVLDTSTPSFCVWCSHYIHSLFEMFLFFLISFRSHSCCMIVILIRFRIKCVNYIC